MAMFKKVAGKVKPVSKKDAEKMIKANRAARVAIIEEEKEENEQQPRTARKPR